LQVGWLCPVLIPSGSVSNAPSQRVITTKDLWLEIKVRRQLARDGVDAVLWIGDPSLRGIRG
jgi:hypothetical protein